MTPHSSAASRTSSLAPCPPESHHLSVGQEPGSSRGPLPTSADTPFVGSCFPLFLPVTPDRREGLHPRAVNAEVAPPAALRHACLTCPGIFQSPHCPVGEATFPPADISPEFITAVLNNLLSSVWPDKASAAPGASRLYPGDASGTSGSGPRPQPHAHARTQHARTRTQRAVSWRRVQTVTAQAHGSPLKHGVRNGEAEERRAGAGAAISGIWL